LAKVPKTSDASGVLTNLPINLPNYKSFVKYFESYFLLGGYKAIIIASITGLLIILSHKKSNRFEIVQKNSILLILIFFNILLIATYTLGSTRVWLEWWMATSFDRILLTPALFSLIAVLLSIAPFDAPVSSGFSPPPSTIQKTKIKKQGKNMAD
jgi:hypothetical protein